MNAVASTLLVLQLALLGGYLVCSIDARRIRRAIDGIDAHVVDEESGLLAAASFEERLAAERSWAHACGLQTSLAVIDLSRTSSDPHVRRGLAMAVGSLVRSYESAARLDDGVVAIHCWSDTAATVQAVRRLVCQAAASTDAPLDLDLVHAAVVPVARDAAGHEPVQKILDIAMEQLVPITAMNTAASGVREAA